jgi:hypothetical protein
MRQPIAVLILYLGVTTTWAQNYPLSGTLAPVYIDFRDYGTNDLASFGARFVQLGLADLKSFNVRVGPSPCRGPNKAGQGGAKTQEFERSGSSPFYVVSGAMAFDPFSSSVDLHYQLSKGCEAPLVEDSRLVKEESLASALTVGTDRIRLRLKEVAPTKPFVVNIVVVSKNERDLTEKAAADDIASYLSAKLEATREFQPIQSGDPAKTGTADYSVHVDVSSGRSSIDTTGTVWAARNQQQVVTIPPTSRPKNQGPELRAISDAALKALNDLRAASETGRSTAEIGTAPPDVLIADANRLLCAEQTRTVTCQPQPEAAVALLTKAPKSDEITLLLGQAELRAGQTLVAARTLEELSMRTQGAIKQGALRFAGDAWLAARNYEHAAQLYASWLEHGSTDEAAPAVELMRDRALRLAHSNSAALEALIQAVQRWPDREEFQIELTQLIGELHPDELRSALPRIDAYSNIAGLSNARASIRARISAQEASSNQFPDAERLLVEAAALAPAQSNVLRLQLAQVYYDHARTLQASPLATDLLNKAVAEVEPLVDKRVLGADWLFLSVNHSRSDDNATVAKLRKILNDNPSDESSLASVAYVCNEFQFDFKCTLDSNEKRLKVAAAQAGPGLQLDLIESQVLNGLLDQAAVGLKSLLLDKGSLGSQLTVALFYSYWTARVQGRETDATFAQWKETLDTLWPVRTDEWSFDGAMHFLNGQTSLTDDIRKTLADMIAKMRMPQFPPIPNAR